MVMHFDADNIGRLEAGQYLKVSACPGLRLRATSEVRLWVYRYRSPVDGKMRHVDIGHWPTCLLADAIVEWEGLVAMRHAGFDPALEMYKPRWIPGRKATDREAAARAGIHTSLL
jgi:hypothetical protein